MTGKKEVLIEKDAEYMLVLNRIRVDDNEDEICSNVLKGLYIPQLSFLSPLSFFLFLHLKL